MGDTGNLKGWTFGRVAEDIHRFVVHDGLQLLIP